jgi:hypothetical protein
MNQFQELDLRLFGAVKKSWPSPFTFGEKTRLGLRWLGFEREIQQEPNVFLFDGKFCRNSDVVNWEVRWRHLWSCTKRTNSCHSRRPFKCEIVTAEQYRIQMNEYLKCLNSASYRPPICARSKFIIERRDVELCSIHRWLCQIDEEIVRFVHLVITLSMNWTECENCVIMQWKHLWSLLFWTARFSHELRLENSSFFDQFHSIRCNSFRSTQTFKIDKQVRFARSAIDQNDVDLENECSADCITLQLEGDEQFRRFSVSISV